MTGLAPKLPLDTGEMQGYTLIKDYKTLAQQNLKMILFTNPGERIMEPNFGVGVRLFLFQPSHQITFEELRERIVQQVGVYLPFININELYIKADQESENTVYLYMRYTIIPLGLQDYLNFTLQPGDN